MSGGTTSLAPCFRNTSPCGWWLDGWWEPPTPPPLVTLGGLTLSDSKKAKALGASLEVQFHPVNDPSEPAVIEVVNVVMWVYSFAPASEPKLTNPTEVQDAIQGLKVGKAPCPNSMPNSSLKHLPLSVVSLLAVLFNAVFWTEYFLAALKDACIFDPETQCCPLLFDQ